MQQVTVSNANPTDFIMLNVDDIVDAPFSNARQKRDPKAYAELRDSVERNGFATAVTVRPAKENGKYELIAGFGRKQVATDLGIPLPCVIRDVSDAQAYEIHMSENLDRENLNFVDEIYAAKQFVSYYGGDRDSAATRLGWSRKKLDERLELLSCDESVLEALQGGSIKPGHALLLAPFESRIQIATIQKVLAENLSVKELRERARKVQLPIAKAKFNTADCQGCAFNSEQQSGLFDISDDGALCSKPACFIQKTQAHLSDVVAEQKHSHGQVIFMTASLQRDRVTVSPANVGDEQYNSGCASCESRAALVDDRPGNEGQVTPSQCMNTSCFNECVGLLEKEKTSKQTPESTSAPETDNGSSQLGTKSAGTQETKPSPTVKQKTPEKVVEKHKAEIRQFAGEYLADNQSVRMAIMAMAIEHFFSDNESTRSAPARLKELLAGDDKVIGEAISRALDNGIRQASTVKNTTPMYDFMAQALACVDGGNDAAIKSWKPTQDNLSPYYAQGIQGMVKSSGVSDALSKGATQGKKADLIKAVVEAEFDWTSFAPAPFIKLLK